MTGQTGRQPRLWELDLLRGVAILMMLLSNLVTDLDFFGVYATEVGDFWWFFARLTGASFVFIAGVSVTLSYHRTRLRTDGAIFPAFLKRGALVFAWGMAITAATYVFVPEGYIFWGVLHLIGFAIVVSYPLMRLPWWAPLALGVLLTGYGLYLGGIWYENGSWAWLGFRPRGLYTVDYFPVLPWFGWFLIGSAVGKIAYPEAGRAFSFPELGHLRVVRALSFLGRHTLKIYLTHQPFFMLLLIVLGLVPLSYFLG